MTRIVLIGLWIFMGKFNCKVQLKKLVRWFCVDKEKDMNPQDFPYIFDKKANRIVSKWVGYNVQNMRCFDITFTCDSVIKNCILVRVVNGKIIKQKMGWGPRGANCDIPCSVKMVKKGETLTMHNV